MKVVCIGSGNVATHLAVALKTAGAELVQIWSRDVEHAADLSRKVGAAAVGDLGQVISDADLYLLSVADDAIPSIAAALPDTCGIIAHTSGATDMNVLSAFMNYGVFYPLQTFSKKRTIDFRNVPFCLEAGSSDVLSRLKGLAVLIGSPHYEVSSDQRKQLHLSAAFACNFVNHLYTIADRLLAEHELDFEVLRPLIAETAEKVRQYKPAAVQTGPAARNDLRTMEQHLMLLEGKPQLQEIYQMMSNSIKKTQA